MPKRKHELTQKPLTKRVKRLLDGLLPRTSTPKQRAPSQRVALVTIDDDDDDDERTESSNGTVPSSSALKRHEDVMKTIGKTISPPPTLAHHQQSATTTQPSVILLNSSQAFTTCNSKFCYSVMYRRYFGLVPPDPSQYNPQLLEDYIDWYINVYKEQNPSVWDAVVRTEQNDESGEQYEEESNQLSRQTAANKI